MKVFFVFLTVFSAAFSVEWVEYPVPTLADAARAAETIFIARVVLPENGETAVMRVSRCIKGVAAGDVNVTRKYLSPGLWDEPDTEYFIFRDDKEYCIFCARKPEFYEPYFRWNTLWAVARVENGLVDLSGFADERKERWVKLEDFLEEVACANGWI